MTVPSPEAMQVFGEKLGRLVKGGEVIELIGDVGAGKTTFTKGLAKGLAVQDDVQSPTFTISRVYEARDGLELVHYDFYRLADPGILKMEIEESVHNPHAVTVVEWGGIIEGVLPEDRVTLRITASSDNERTIDVQAGGECIKTILEAL